MHRLMILGSMDEFIPLVQRARERGYYTIVCDGYEDGPAKEYADISYNLDIHQVDKIAELCKRENADGIIASFSDLLFEYLVKIADKAQLKTYCTPEQSENLRSKEKMRRMFAELGIPCSRYLVLEESYDESELDALRFPVVMKPVNGYGSRGVFVVNSREEVRQRFAETAQYSIDSAQIMVEEYNDGYEFNMMNWIMDGEVYTLSIADREKTKEENGEIPHLTRLVYPSRFTDTVYKEAKEIVSKVAAYVGITTGPLCMQFFYSPDDGIRVCECAGRFFGYEHELLLYSGNFSIVDLLLDYLYDESAMRERVKNHSFHLPKYVAGLYFHGHEGVVGDTAEAEKVLEQIKPLSSILYYHKGEHISHEVGAKPYALRLDIEAADYEKLDEMSRQVAAQIHLYDEEGKDLLYQSRIPEYQ